MPVPFTVLLSSAGRRVALLNAFRSALSDLGLAGRVLAADMSAVSSAFHAADAGFVVPRCTSEDFVPAMLDLCRREGIRLIVPTIDTELPVYAAHRDRFSEAGVAVAVSAPHVVAIGGDKERTHDWLVRSGLPTVLQASPGEVLAETGAWTYPLIVKPALGSSSIGVSIVRDPEELRLATHGGGFIVQTIARGAEYTIDFLANRQGQCVCAVPRRRLEVRAGEVSKAVTVRSKALEELASNVCAALHGAYGCLNVQAFLDEETGTISVIEINPRFGGGFPLSWEAGAEFPRWIIEEILDLPATSRSDGWKDGLVMLRFDSAVFVDRSKAGL